MVIQEFGAIAFRNYQEVFVTFSGSINIFIGGNGQGKTNLAEGIYFLTHLSSFRTPRLAPLVNDGQSRAYLQGSVIKSDLHQVPRVELSDGGRRAWLDGRPVPTLSAYLSLFYSLLFNPDSLYNYRHVPAERRQLFDRFISFLNGEYLAAIRSFRAALSQKNSLLKSRDYSTLPEWNQLLIENSCVMIKERAVLVEKVNTFLPELFSRLTGRKERLRMAYRPSLQGDPAQDGERLHKAMEREVMAGHALYGPHRDDYRMALGSQEDDLLSQGEYRAALLALKLALNELMSERATFRPVLILDDLYSELDGEVRARLSEHLKSLPNQVFITTTESPEALHIPGEHTMEIRQGRIV